MNEITIAPISILVNGANKAERQISVVRQATAAALTASLNVKGKVGKEIRDSGARAGLVDVATHAAKGNYRPLAEMLAIRTGEPIMISGRSTFEALPDIMQAKIEQAKLGKNEGMRLDKKSGALVPGAKLAIAMELKALCVEIVRAAAEFHNQRATQSTAIEA